jgi:hypothetical protein
MIKVARGAESWRQPGEAARGVGFVEPPWEYRVEGRVITLVVMGTVSRLDLWSGQSV